MYYISSPFSSLILQMTEAIYYEYYNFYHIIYFNIIFLIYIFNAIVFLFNRYNNESFIRESCALHYPMMACYILQQNHFANFCYLFL